ncbi:MAG: ATP-dependent RecD-like DNA helicase [Oscillospiraceae bacterium]|nr:ATP-dependent RecD-like DNA helicase [Oscillospiraceae bacterium]
MNRHDTTPMLTISGRVEHVVYANADTGYTVLEVDAAGDLISVVGELGEIAPGEEASFTGRYHSHPTYGEQFRAQLCERRMPATASAILKYLSSGVIKGIGTALARRIVSRFGDETLTIIEKQPELLREISGISPKKAASIAEQYQRVFGIRAAMLYLGQFGIEMAASVRIWKEWGALIKERMEENPFALMDEAIGLSFEQADTVATALGMQPEDPRRLRAGLTHVLEHNLRVGHTCLPRDKLLPTTAALLGAHDVMDTLSDALGQALYSGELVGEDFAGGQFVYLPKMQAAESFIAGRIAIMLAGGPAPPPELDDEIEELEARLGLSFHPLQKKAVGDALSCGVFILTGGPGTGKTTTLNALIALLEHRGAKVALAAPTGRAAKRMSELTGREASTIHRLLGVGFPDKKTGQTFKHNEKNPLQAGVVILDEASMVDTPLLYHLLKAIRLSCRLILVGDPDQLPCVGPGNILKDLIECGAVPCVHLTEIFRQAQDSLIVRGAHAIVAGETPELGQREGDFFFISRRNYETSAATLAELCEQRLPAAYGFSPMWDIQVIAPSRVGALGTVELNKLLQARLNPKDPGRAQLQLGQLTLRERDKVMQVQNNYDLPWTRDGGEEGLGVFNGDIGVIEGIEKGGEVRIRYDDRLAYYSPADLGQLEHAYAITAHKSQGSEFEAVIIPLMSYHEKLYYRNILYTAVTRAKRLLVIIGREETVRQMVQNNRKVLRYTQLGELLRRETGGG